MGYEITELFFLLSHVSTFNKNFYYLKALPFLYYVSQPDSPGTGHLNGKFLPNQPTQFTVDKIQDHP